MEKEQRLIDANALIEQFDDSFKGFVMKRIVEMQPTVDAVPVVRCKDCEFWGGVTFGNVCHRWSAPLAGMKNCTTPDDFCSYGERRTDV